MILYLSGKFTSSWYMYNYIVIHQSGKKLSQASIISLVEAEYDKLVDVRGQY